MNRTILTLKIHAETDIVLARQRTRQMAKLLGFDSQDQTRIATAVSEIARNAFQYAGSGIVKFSVDQGTPPCFWITVSDLGSGIANLNSILDGHYTSSTGMGLGLVGTRRLMDHFEIESILNQGTTVLLGKNLPRKTAPINSDRLVEISGELAKFLTQNPLEEIRQQNKELLDALAQLRTREEELSQTNQELEDTNRGVVALYTELNEKAESLKRISDLKTSFLSNMSHEFRTPLNSIRSLSNFLLNRMDGELTGEQEKQVSLIRKSAQELTELVNDLLDLAKVEAGKIDIYPAQFTVGDLFGTLRGMLRPLLAHNSSISLNFEESDVQKLYTDENKVGQILRNLISNALKYTESGEVRVAAIQTGKTITFSVTDTGIGIAPEDIDRIFEDFVQLASPLQRRIQGTGLGLPLSRQLAQLLGGNISVSSTLGRGSTFSLMLPMIYPDNQPESVEFPQINPERLPVLVLEDNPETLFTYGKYFEKSRYQMIAASTLEQAEKALQLFKFSAIILDVLLKEKNTWELLTVIKHDEVLQEIPCLVATVIDNEKKAVSLGADAFFIKPVDGWLLLNTLNRLLKREAQQTILLIDDDPSYRSLFRECLDGTGLSLIEADRGSEGIRLAQDKQPIAIVLDLTMPEMSGIEVLKKLKDDPLTCQIPVVIYTLKLLEDRERQQLTCLSAAILSKELSPQTAGLGIRETLLRLGLHLMM
ncbi:ATP-binding protein [Chroococcus sp. FPU101]|uniref:ATP-binding protein n=1 Tax=Chroococcus sp. FPU101 TaxID=1974212 RepID=UPI001A8F8430|nr:ATP-binding protein [Chroococcus sp. FPU101]GFE68964.1 hybrid histidine kinase [Chroococcus sp. FPU101]